MNRVCCKLPKAVRSFCKDGCIYKEKGFRKLSCPNKTFLDTCEAPCKKPCPCSPQNEPKGLLEYKYYHEVQLLQAKNTY